MQIWLIRILFIVFSTALGGFLKPQPQVALTGFILSLGIVSVEYILKRNTVRVILICLIGLILGLVAASLSIYIGGEVGIEGSAFRIFAASSTLIFSYMGIMMVYHKRDELSVISVLSHGARSKKQDFKILDTSVLIDGRISDICRTGFIEGTILVPRFVLGELQYIADSTDTLRRNKGRRGFDMLEEMQNNPDIDFKITEEDFPDINDVDAKIIQLAKEIGARVITNDFNLNKVAELQAITVLNINELAASVKPMVVHGETMTVRVLREGKEFNQGVAYLDDGTMVIVEDGKKYLGQTIEVVVNTVLATDAGRMIFTRKKGDETENAHEDNRRHSRGWSRDKNGGRY